MISIAGYSQQDIIKTASLSNDNTKPYFFGGGIALGGGSGFFQLGLNPEILLQYNHYIDLGAASNIYFTSYNATSFSSIKSRKTQLGLGAFARIWPLEQFFIQAQPEYNWTWSSAKDLSSGQSGSAQVGAPSFLTGVGYGKRNESGIAYVSVLFDLINDVASPYRMGQTSPQPIIRAGFGFVIGQKKSH
jgi:hypothetical protein